MNDIKKIRANIRALDLNHSICCSHKSNLEKKRLENLNSNQDAFAQDTYRIAKVGAEIMVIRREREKLSKQLQNLSL